MRIKAGQTLLDLVQQGLALMLIPGIEGWGAKFEGKNSYLTQEFVGSSIPCNTMSCDRYYRSHSSGHAQESRVIRFIPVIGSLYFLEGYERKYAMGIDRKFLVYIHVLTPDVEPIFYRLSHRAHIQTTIRKLRSNEDVSARAIARIAAMSVQPEAYKEWQQENTGWQFA